MVLGTFGKSLWLRGGNFDVTPKNVYFHLKVNQNELLATLSCSLPAYRIEFYITKQIYGQYRQRGHEAMVIPPFGAY